MQHYETLFIHSLFYCFFSCSFSLNISTGIDASGAALPIGSVDPNWIIASGPTGSWVPAVVAPGLTWFWQPSPVAGTNANWMNTNSTNYSLAGVYTYERPFTVPAGATALLLNFGIAFDDDCLGLNLISPSGAVIPLAVTNSPIAYHLSSFPVPGNISCPEVGVWKVQVLVHYIDQLGGFMLSGEIDVSSDPIYAVPVSGLFTATPGVVCPDEPVTLSAVFPNNLPLALDPGDGTPNLPGNTAVHSYSLPGTYFPKVVRTDSSGCALYSTVSVIVSKPVAAFVTSNQILCDSGSVTLSSTSTPATGIASYLWTFPASPAQTGPTASLAHSTSLGYFHTSVTLTVTDIYGCTDSITDTVTISTYKRPEAYIIADHVSGCAPFAPSVHDSVVTVFPTSQTWLLWNGSISTPLPPPVAPVLSAGSYVLELVVTDIHGCTDTSRLPLEAHPIPIPDFSLPQTHACAAPFTAAFQNLTASSPPSQFLWTFGDGSSSPDSLPIHTYLEDGFFTVTLTATNTFGCKDSVVKSGYVNLYSPEVSFEADLLQVCPGVPITFSATATGHAAISSYFWDFGDGPPVPGGAGITHVYTTPGTYTIAVLVRDVLGCEDLFTRPLLIEVKRNDPPEAPQLRNVTVVDDQTIQVQWNPYQGDPELFGTYQLWRRDTTLNATLVFSSPHPEDATWTDTGISPLTQPYCYALEVVNGCGFKSAPADVHCSIETQTTAVPDLNLISWTPYLGWNVVQYQVFRVTDYGSAGVFIGAVPGTTQHFGDTLVYCNTPVSYRITALGQTPWQVSQSDTARALSMHSPPLLAAQVRNGTIADNADAEVLWEIPYVRAASQVLLERRIYGVASDRWTWTPQTLPSLPWRDQDIQAQDHWYTYHLRVVDACNDTTPAGTYGQTIRLKARKTPEDQAILQWNPYTGWPQGVVRYEIERQQEGTGTYLPLVTILPGTTTWRDTLEQDQQLTHCYRIRAFGAGGAEQNSLSNEACITLESVVWVPNAFSPNGDEANETFWFPGKYTGMMTMKIVDRWGELLYQETSLHPAWDGRYKDHPVQEGTYMYVLTGTGIDGQWFDFSGWVQLIR